VIGDGHASVDRGEQLAPGVGLRNAVRGFQADFRERGDRFGAAADGDDVGEGGEVALAIDMPLDCGKEMAEADAGHEDHDIDLARDESIGEVDGVAILLDGHLAHAGADKGAAAEFFDEAGHLRGAATFEGGDAEVGKVGHFFGHGLNANGGLASATVGRVNVPSREVRCTQYRVLHTS
jgi:hypothetical protein